MSNEITEVFGCAVKFLDDRKRKYQSHEAHISKRTGVNGFMGSASVDAEGYGATPEEALNNLRLVVDELIGPNADEIERLRTALDGLLSGDVGRQTLATLATGQGTDTDDGRAWIRAKVMMTPNPL